MRALAETEVLTGARGAYGLGRPLAAIQVPRTVQAVLAARIDRLSREGKRLLQCAAVVGRDVPFPVLEAIADLDPDALRAGLAQLQSAEFLHETHLFPELEHAFKHTLTQDVAYGTLLQDTRRALHARIVDAIERLYPDRLVEQVERLAHHALRGGLATRAVAYLRQAGTKAAARSAHRDAVGFFEQAIEALDALPRTREHLELGVDLRFDARASLAPLGLFARNLEHLRRAETLARPSPTGGGSAGWAPISPSPTTRSATRTRRWRPRAALAQDRGGAGRSAPEGGRDHRGRAAYHALGDYAQAQVHLGRAVDALEGDLASERFGMAGLLSVAARVWLVNSLVAVGDFDGERRARSRRCSGRRRSIIPGAWRPPTWRWASPSSRGARSPPPRRCWSEAWPARASSISPHGCPCSPASSASSTSVRAAWTRAPRCSRTGSSARPRSRS